MVVGVLPSRSWSAVQSQAFSQYEEDDAVRWACMKAALQGCVVDWQAVCTRESAAPPMRVCVLWKLTEPGEEEGEAMFTSMRMVPGRMSETVRRRSEISARPVSPGEPMRRRGRGEVEELKLGPEAVRVFLVLARRFGDWIIEGHSCFLCFRGLAEDSGVDGQSCVGTRELSIRFCNNLHSSINLPPLSHEVNRLLAEVERR